MGSGRFIWHELVTEDRFVGRFYEELFGWEIHSRRNLASDYDVIHAGDQEIGGLAAQDGSGTATHWLPFIETPGLLEAACERAIAAGGDVIQGPRDWRAMGQTALLADPDGALAMAIELYPDHSRDLPNAAEGVPWRAVGGRDAMATAAFYAEVFGFETRPHPVAASPNGYQLLCSGDAPAAGVFGHGGRLPSRWHVHFPVVDLDRTRGQATALGGRACTPAMTIPGIGRMCGVIDPAGAIFYLLEADVAGGPFAAEEQPHRVPMFER
jgi:predicted enzyme related to lactoylglutathione lyase